ncbi:hypothetical protein ACQP00_14990 [Dactylosporangium sp. CS-047395]|uniref:hypothetical protein n=1 Tax=Dactylosporangium sp. CS-047395 TaxID=3239936 RepID=UPI003D8CD70D
MYRSHYEGQWSKHIRRLPDRGVLDWFRRGWDSGDPDGWAEAELGVDPYGLHTVFDAAAEHDLPKPGTLDELRAQLHEHLYVEGDPDEYIRLDEHSLRVRTDDDEVELAYFFLDDEVLAAHPERLAYVVHEGPLPADSGAGEGEPSTFAVFLTYYDGSSLEATPPFVFPGVSLPELPAHLRAAEPDSDVWPPELMVLQALTAPGDETVRPALERCNRWPGFNINADPWPEDTTDAWAVLAGAEFESGRNPELSVLQAGEHLAQLAMHCDDFFGFQQWYLFDTDWAAAHPDLASSLLRYATHWDPLSGGAPLHPDPLETGPA